MRLFHSILLCQCFLTFLGSPDALAQTPRISGGNISYKFLLYNPDSKLYKYRVDLKLYQPCPHDTFPSKLEMNVFKAGDYSKTLYSLSSVPREYVKTVTPGHSTECIDVFPEVCYKVANYYAYIFVKQMPEDAEIIFTGGNREPGITNLAFLQTAAYKAIIPGNATDSSAMRNSSPEFYKNEAKYLCANSPFEFDAGARDDDKDSIAYHLCSAYSLTGPDVPLTYAQGYTEIAPMGKKVTINSETGIVSGIAPGAGKYLISVCAMEYRKGKYLCTNRKEFLLRVGDCNIARADLPEKTMSCKGFTVSFANKVNIPMIRSYRWDFGIPGSDADTSTQMFPMFTYPDTGVYRARLIINEGLMCDDTAYTDVYVYPVVDAGFHLASACIFPGTPVNFINTTTTTYGTITRWEWDLGQPGPFGNELSADQHPVYRYRTSDTFQVVLVAEVSNGCVDTVRKDIIVYSYDLLQVTNDTAICIGDTLQLFAAGKGQVHWTPGYRISDPDSRNPYVFPDKPVNYKAALTILPGCTIEKEVKVEAKSFITVDAGADTTICLTDTLKMRPLSDGLKYRWAPSRTIPDPSEKNALAIPDHPVILYKVTANTGSCVASDSLFVYTVPYPTVQINKDTAVCYGETIRLQASGGVQYTWSPPAGLSDIKSPSPLASPRETTTYQVAVTDVKGCPKPSFGQVQLKVIPPVKAFAGYDTAIIAGQPLQLTATGAAHYQWTPATGLNNTHIHNPVAVINDNITYRVRVSTDEGCSAYDDISVHVFKTAPDIFVPNAFTPNSDGRNDVIRPTPVGIRKFEYFAIYNRWGQLVYRTTIPTVGWTGGSSPVSGTYVWESKGVDYTGKTIIRRGSFVLIR